MGLNPDVQEFIKWSYDTALFKQGG
jgi:hypothetical protein